MNKKSILILVVILAIAAVLRFWQFGNVPPSPDWDEAALGYNAYSILQTGKDEHGQPFPFILRSFDDYKPALYAYLTVPFVKLLGLNVIAVRVPSAIFGILTVAATYFLLKDLFGNHQFKLGIGPPAGGWELGIAELASFLLAISPWHIQFSRIGFESNVGLAFNIFAILFFVKGLKNSKLFLLSPLCMIASLYTYQSEKIFVPLLIIILAIVFFKRLMSLPKRYIAIAIALLVVLAMPLTLYTLTSKEARSRAAGVSVFTDETPFVKEYTTRVIIDAENKDIPGLIFDNRRVAYLKAMLTGYFSHYNPYWLFISGDIARHHAPEMGLLYLWELPFLLLGIYSLIFGNFDKRTKLFVFFWFLIAPIPASLTTGVPHAVRTLNFLPTFQIFIAIGVIFALRGIYNFQWRKLIVAFCLLFVAFNITYYLDQYFVQQNYFYSQAWQHGYKEAVMEVDKLSPNYNKIIVSNEPHLDQSYIFFLFYLQYSPSQYQYELNKNSSGGFRETHQFGKYEFRPIKDENKNIEKTLFVGRPNDFPQGAHIIKMIYFLDGQEAIWIAQG